MLCLTLCDPVDCSPPGSSVHRISQARILEQVATSFSRGASRIRGLNSHLLCLLHWKAGSLPLNHQGGPKHSVSVSYSLEREFQNTAPGWLGFSNDVSCRWVETSIRFSRVWLFVTPWTAARQAPLFFTISQSLLKLMSNESVMSSNHLILCCPLLLLPSIFPIREKTSGSFPMSGNLGTGLCTEYITQRNLNTY